MNTSNLTKMLSRNLTLELTKNQHNKAVFIKIYSI